MAIVGDLRPKEDSEWIGIASPIFHRLTADGCSERLKQVRGVTVCLQDGTVDRGTTKGTVSTTLIAEERRLSAILLRTDDVKALELHSKLIFSDVDGR